MPVPRPRALHATHNNTNVQLSTTYTETRHATEEGRAEEGRAQTQRHAPPLPPSLPSHRQFHHQAGMESSSIRRPRPQAGQRHQSQWRPAVPPRRLAPLALFPPVLAKPSSPPSSSSSSPPTTHPSPSPLVPLLLLLPPSYTREGRACVSWWWCGGGWAECEVVWVTEEERHTHTQGMKGGRGVEEARNHNHTRPRKETGWGG